MHAKVKLNIKGRGKGKRPRTEERTQEYWGVAIGFKEELEHTRSYGTPRNCRIIEIRFKMSGPPLVIVGIYAPHTGRPIEEKESFYNYLNSRLDEIADCKGTLIGTLRKQTNTC